MTGREVTRERRRVVRLSDTEMELDVAREASGIAVHFVDGQGSAGLPLVLVSSWKPGDPVWSGLIDGEPVAVQVRPIPNGFLLAHRGIETKAYVYTDREAQAARLMPVKQAADTGKMLLCPMPGLVMSIAVAEGQEVKAGETLAVVEAMKMENVLRAERDGVVKTIRAKKGDSLAVDAVIMEFA
jgi:propionyl-CoA carboxylase alpha chain